MKVEIEETRITVVLKTDGSELGSMLVRQLLKQLHEAERQWENYMGEESAFLVDPVKFEVAKVTHSFHQTGKPLIFADET